MRYEIHEILALRLEDGAPAGHTHVSRIRLGDGREVSLEQVLSALRRGDRFFTRSDSEAFPAEVIERECPGCGRRPSLAARNGGPIPVDDPGPPRADEAE